MAKKKKTQLVRATDLDTLRDINAEAIEVLAHDRSPAEPGLADKVREIRRSHAQTLHSDIIYALSNLRFDEETARRKWLSILQHKYVVSEKLGRNIGIRVAMLDYFHNITRELKSVTMIEVTKLEETTRDSITDWLTGAFLKGHFRELAAAELDRSARNQLTCSLLFLDIDWFKKYNDIHGHLQGDILLKLLSNYIADLIRPYDIMGRYGGEEFVVLFPETNTEQAMHRAEEIRQTVEGLPLPGAKEMPEGKITISGGVASFPVHADKLDPLLAAADDALYHAKRGGRNRIAMAGAEI